MRFLMLLVVLSQVSHGLKTTDTRLSSSLENPIEKNAIKSRAGIPHRPALAENTPEPRRSLKRTILKYFGGPVLTFPILNVYLIYYGAWTEKQKNTVRGFVNSLTNSSTTPQGPGVNTVAGWWNIVTKYYDESKKYASGKVVVKGEVSDPLYSQGKQLPDDMNDVFNVVSFHLQRRAFPLDPSGMYLVLTDPSVTVGDSLNGFCGDNGYCGWHLVNSLYYHGSSSPSSVYYGFAGNGASQCQDCTAKGPKASMTAPSGDVGVDGMLSTIGHELAEMVTDPDALTGWITVSDASGDENGDLCADMYDGAKTVVRGKSSYAYNLAGQGGLQYYIQDLWDLQMQACRLNDANRQASSSLPPPLRVQ